MKNNKLKEILFNPGKFFSNVKKEKGVKDALKFFAFYFLVFWLLSIVTFFIGWGGIFLLDTLPIEIPTTVLILIIVGVYAFALLFSFVSAFLLQVWVKLFKGKSKFQDAYKLKIYSNAPYYILGWIPFIWWLSGIYSLVLLIIGTREIYKFSTLKATLIYVIPMAIMFVLLVILFVLLLLYFISFASLEF